MSVTTYSNYYGDKVFTALIGIVYPIRSALGSLSPVVAGILYDTYGGYSIAFIGVGILAGFGALCLFIAKPPLSNRLISSAKSINL